MLLSVLLEVYPWHIVFFLPLFRLLPLALTLCVFAIDSGEHGKGSLNDDICATWVVWFLHVFPYCWLLVSLIVLILLLKCLSLCNYLDVCQCFTTRRIIAAGWVNYLAPAVINSIRLLSSYHQRYAAQYGELGSWYIASFITIFISLAMKTCLTGLLPSLAPWLKRAWLEWSVQIYVHGTFVAYDAECGGMSCLAHVVVVVVIVVVVVVVVVVFWYHACVSPTSLLTRSRTRTARTLTNTAYYSNIVSWFCFSVSLLFRSHLFHASPISLTSFQSFLADSLFVSTQSIQQDSEVRRSVLQIGLC